MTIIFGLSKHCDIWSMLENHPTWKRSHKETRKAVVFMNIIMGLSFKPVIQWVLHGFTFHCWCLSVCLLHISVCKLTRKLQLFTLINPKSWERVETYKRKKSVVIVPLYISNLKNCSSLGILIYILFVLFIFIASCGKYFAKSSLDKNYYNFNFFNHRIHTGFWNRFGYIWWWWIMF